MKMESGRNIDHGYAWIIMLASFGVQFLTGTVFIGFSVLLVELTEVFQVSKATAGWVGSISTGAMGLSGLFYGNITARIGSRKVTVVCGVVAAFGYLMTSFVPNIYVMYITYGVITGTAIGGPLLTTVVIVQQYFDKRRAFAAGISMMGASIGSFVFSPVFRLLVDHFGWRGALLIHSGIVLNITVLGALFRPPPSRKTNNTQPSTNKHKGDEEVEEMQLNTSVRDDVSSSTPSRNGNSDKEKQSQSTCMKKMLNIFDPTVLKMKCFIVYLVGTILWIFGIGTMYNHSPSRAVFNNIDKTQASLIPSALALCSTMSRVLASFVGSMRCTNRSVYFATVCTAGGVVLCLTCIMSSSFVGSMVMAGLYGAFFGQLITLSPTVMVDIVGISLASVAQGWVQFAFAFPSFAAVPLAGWLFDTTGNYDLPFLVAGGIQIVAGILFFIIPIGPKLRRAEKEDEDRGDKGSSILA